MPRDVGAVQIDLKLLLLSEYGVRQELCGEPNLRLPQPDALCIHRQSQSAETPLAGLLPAFGPHRHERGSMILALFLFALGGGLVGTLGGALVQGMDGLVLGGSSGFVLGVILWIALWVAYNHAMPSGLDKDELHN